MMILLGMLLLLKLVDGLPETIALGSCPNNLSVIDLNYAEFSKLPKFFTFATGTTQYSGVDSICVTADCLPDSPLTFILHVTTVFSDGSVSLSTSIQNQITSGLGISTISSSSGYQLQYVLGYTTCGTYVSYGCGVCGSDTSKFGLGSSSVYGRISDACLADVKRVLVSQNINADNITVFPMQLGPQCYYSSCTNCYESANPCTCSILGENGCYL